MTTTMTNVSTKTPAIEAVERKTKVLRITLALTVLSLVIFLITLTSSHWIFVTYPIPLFSTKKNMFIRRSTYGIIFECLVGGSTAESKNGQY
jgi:hypothetical protein